jgi:hypothetical protein
VNYTDNYNLRKPELTDPVDIDDLNYNADEIDSLLKGLADGLDGITPEGIGAETPTGAQQKANQAETNAKSYADIVANGVLNSAKDYADIVTNNALNSAKDYADGVLESANSHTDQVASDLSQKLNKTRIKVLDVEQDVSNINKVLINLNPNHEAKQTASGYGTVTLPKNAANGQISASVKGQTVHVAWGAIAETTISTGVGSYPNISPVFSPALPTGKYLIFYNIIAASSMSNLNSPYVEYHDATTTYESLAGNYNRVTGRKVWKLDAAKNISRLRYGATGLTSTVTIKEFMIVPVSDTEYAKSTSDLLNEYNFMTTGTKSTIGAVKSISVGKNFFSTSVEDWEQGSINPTTGIEFAATTRMRNKKYARVPALTQVRLSRAEGYDLLSFWEFDINKNFIKFTTSTASITTTAQTAYIRSVVSKGGGTQEIIPSIDLELAKPQLELGAVATPYEPHTESTQYITAKDEEGNIAELRSLPNGTKDEIRVSENKLIKRIGDKTNVASGTVIDYSDMTTGGQFVAYASDGTSQVGVKGDTLTITATTLTYQLATPIEIPIQTSGSLVSYPSGTVYIEPYVADAGIYADKMTVLHQDLPIKALEKLSKIDFMTGLETELDVSDAVIAEDKLSFTHPGLDYGDIVFFEYQYDRESTIPEMEVEYYDSRYVIKDSVTGKIYKWQITVANGVPSIELTEV